MIDIENDGISMRLTLSELEPFIRKLDREALIRLVIKLSAQVHHLQEIVTETKPSDAF